MKAFVLKRPGPVENLELREIDQPVIANQEVLVKVNFISVNPVDIKTRKGGAIFQYCNIDPNTEIILGWDISGTVVATRSEKFKIGDKVFGMVKFPGLPNGYSEYVAAPAEHLALVPANISSEQAAAATLAAVTAWQFLSNKIKKGDRIFIHAASGGVGHFAVQIAKYFGAYVIGSSSAANKEFVLSLGADEHFDYKTQKLSDIKDKVDFLLDAVSQQSIIDSLDIVKESGTIISLNSESSDQIKEKASAKLVSVEFPAVSSNGEDINSIAELLEKEQIIPRISEIFPFEKMWEVHALIDSGRAVGKVLVQVA